MNKIEIEIPDGKKAEWINGVLTLVDDKPKDVTERIKTFEDARRELGEDHQFVQEWKMIRKTLAPDLEAYMRLRIITAALNEGWNPKFNGIESCWHVMVCVYNKELYESLTPEEKKHVICLRSKKSDEDVLRVIISCVSSSVYLYSGTFLWLKTKELAQHAIDRFKSLYIGFYVN